MAINFLQSYDLQVNEKRGELPVFLCGLPHIARVKYEGSFVLSHKKVLRIFELAVSLIAISMKCLLPGNTHVLGNEQNHVIQNSFERARHLF